MFHKTKWYSLLVCADPYKNGAVCQNVNKAVQFIVCLSECKQEKMTL